MIFINFMGKFCNFSSLIFFSFRGMAFVPGGTPRMPGVPRRAAPRHAAAGICRFTLHCSKPDLSNVQPHSHSVKYNKLYCVVVFVVESFKEV
jgi:hypothetical protein